MRVHLHFDIELGGRDAAMGNWIQNLKRSEEAERDKWLLEEAARQQNTARIKEVLPLWWTQFVGCVEDRLRELKAAFPDNYAGHFAAETDARDRCLVVRSESAGRGLRMRIMESYPALVVESMIRPDATSDLVAINPKQTSFALGADGLTVSCNGAVYGDAGSLADRILQNFINIVSFR